MSYDHKVLVVDDEAKVGRAIRRILEKENLKSVFADSGESALEILKTQTHSFALIICDQRMAGMKGTQFLAHAKKIIPDTIRFLLTGYSEMQTIINAVNQGSIQKYISKPWNHEEMIQAIRLGIKQYERFLDSEKLFILVKKQNTKLYELNCELMETTKHHNKRLMNLDNEIESLKVKLAEQLKNTNSRKTMGPARIMEELMTIVKPHGENGKDILNDLLSQTIKILFNDFSDLALKNGFEMPEPRTDGSDA